MSEQNKAVSGKQQQLAAHQQGLRAQEEVLVCVFVCEVWVDAGMGGWGGGRLPE